jgi:hypothetical protein
MSRSATSWSATLPAAATGAAAGGSPKTRRIGAGDGGGGGAATGVGRDGAVGEGLSGTAICSASSASQADLVGAMWSSAHASRWRAVATWLSQHATEQNTRRVRARLQVETLHWKYFELNAMSVRQALHLSHVSAMPPG